MRGDTVLETWERGGEEQHGIEGVWDNVCTKSQTHIDSISLGLGRCKVGIKHFAIYLLIDLHSFDIGVVIASISEYLNVWDRLTTLWLVGLLLCYAMLCYAMLCYLHRPAGYSYKCPHR